MCNMDKLVFIVNGKPRAGKDTFAEILNRYMKVYKYSSVTKVKEIATLCGWDGKKEERDRKFLHELKMLTSEYSDLAYNDVLNEIEKYRRGEIEADVLLVDIREPEEIKKLINALTGFESMGIDVISLLVIRKSGEDTPNQPAETRRSDDEALINSYEYDVTINNDEDLIKLQELAAEFVDKLLEDEYE